ncbi:22821_t:CDS:2, partial [Racocetra persica]
NIRKAYELVGKAQNKLNWRPEGLGIGDVVAGVFTLNVVPGVKVAKYLERAISEMVDVSNLLNQAQIEISFCSCKIEKDLYKNRGSELVNDYNNLSNNSTNKYNGLVDRYNDLQSNSKEKYNALVVSKSSFERLETEYRKNIADYNRLVGENSGLQERFDELTQRFNRLNEDNGELREKYERERESWHQEELRLSRNEERIRQEATGLRENLVDARRELTDTRNERNDLLIRVDEANIDIRLLTIQMADLQVESNDRNTQLRTTRQDLARVQQERDERITSAELENFLNTLWRREEEVASLREQLGQSRESGLTEKLRNKGQKLESFIHRLGMELGQIQLLRDIYNELVRSRKNGDINGIRENQSIIETIKQNLLQDRIHLDDVQEICDKCEEIAQLNLQLEQQFEARIEILEISEVATSEDIKKAYRNPEERLKANEMMQKINQAYEVLGDEEKKRRYDLGAGESDFSAAGNMIYEIEVGDDENDTEFFIDRRKVNEFKEKMIAAIRKRSEELKAGINVPAIDKARNTAINSIEKELTNRNLKVEDLAEEHRNYREQINNLTKVYQIRSFEDRGRQPEQLEKETAGSKREDGFSKEPEKEPEKKEVGKFQKNKGKYDNWTREELTKRIEELEVENKNLKEEIEELKKENDNSPEFRAYLNQKENELQNRQQQLEQLRSIALNAKTPPKPKINSDNFSTETLKNFYQENLQEQEIIAQTIEDGREEEQEEIARAIDLSLRSLNSLAIEPEETDQITAELTNRLNDLTAQVISAEESIQELEESNEELKKSKNEIEEIVRELNLENADWKRQ